MWEGETIVRILRTTNEIELEKIVVRLRISQKIKTWPY